MDNNADYSGLYAIDAERAVLGAMICHGAQAVDTVVCRLDEDDFGSEEHAKIFVCIRELADNGEPVDDKTVAAEITRRGGLNDDTDVKACVYALAYEHACAVSGIAYFSKAVKEKALRRKFLSAVMESADDVLANGKGAREALSDIDGKMFDLLEVGEECEPEPLDKNMPNTYEEIDELWPEIAQGIPTGFTGLDEMIGGLRGGNAVIIGGRPSMGKTGFALSIARHVAIRGERTVAFFSLEMSKREIRDRIVAAEAHINLGVLTNGNIPKYDRHKLLEASKAACYKRLIIDDTASVTVHRLCAKARRIKAKYGLDLIVVDYLQIITPNEKSGNTNQEITKISRALKILAKRLDVPVVALAQLSRAVEQRKGSRRPVLSDLRESGAIEQDADVVMFVFREEAYNDAPEVKGKAEILVSKNRNGATGTVEVAFVNQYASFENLSDRTTGGFN